MKRPFTVTTIAWMVLYILTWNMIRLIAALDNWNSLKEFAPRPGPLYILATASFWTLCGLALWQAIRRRRILSARPAFAFILVYAAWWWIDRLLLQSPGANWPFALTLTFLLCAWAGVMTFHPQTKAYFEKREPYDLNPTNSKTA